MINLYEKGNLVGEIQQFEFHQGHKEMIDIPKFSGMEYVHGRREPDVVTFNLPFFHDTAGIHELVDEEGNVMEITFVDITVKNDISFVKAYVQSIRKS
ncbi:MAG: hypothetical protein V1720_06645 [bacterium]